MKKIDISKLTWDLTDVYKNVQDPQMEKDIEKIEHVCESFSKKYAESDLFLSDNKVLLQSLKDYEALAEFTSLAKPLWYLYNMQSLNSSDQKITARIGLLEPRVVSAVNKTLFYSIKLGKLSEQSKKKILTDESLARYKYFLHVIFENARFDLSEETEKVLNLIMRPANAMWSDSFEKLLNSKTVKFKGKDLPIGQALNKVHQIDTKDRRILDAEIKKELSKIAFFAVEEINAVYTAKKITDDLRGFKKPYESTILGYENSVQGIENMVESVTKNFKISHRFYKLKSKLLGLPQLKYCDRAVGVAKIKKEVSFETAVEILSDSFSSVDKEYLEILHMMLKNKKIDVPSRVGKRGGAYCCGGHKVPTLVLLNYVPSVDSVLTFAHEMGHAIHTELSNRQPAIYSHYTISVAEVASTFFENLAFKKIYSEANEKEKFYLLYDRVADSIQTIFRQIACFNFEKDLHESVRKEGAVSLEKIKELHNKNMKAYLGPVFKLEKDDGYFFEVWSHIRNFFYVYSYAYGDMISKALYKKCEEDPEYFKVVKHFMLAGKSMSPDDIFKSVGLDTTKNSFFETALKSIEDDIKTLEKLSKKVLK